MYLRHHPRGQRRGAILPLVALAIIALVSMVALAIDIGVIALARNQCQNAADAAALAAVRTLNGDVTNNNNYAAVAPEAQAVAAANSVLNTPIPNDPNVVQTTIGYYAYDATAQQFSPNFSGTKPASENWDAVQVTVSVNNPTFFAKIFNINSFSAGATSTSVHRPRDIAIVLDFSGSMRFSSDTAYPSSGTYTGSLNPDTVMPQFGHWSDSAYTSVMGCASTFIYTDSQGYAYAANNMTVTTQNGPPMVLDYSWRDSSGNLQAGTAFDKTGGAVPSPYVVSTWACPAPADWATQSSATVQYGGSSGQGGDLWPCNNLTLTPGTYAATVQQFLAGNNNTQATSASASLTTFPITGGGGGGTFDPGSTALTNSLQVLTDIQGYGPNFKGYSMGPGYYGKTFYMWPPDPRYNFGRSTNPASPSTTSSVPKDTNGNYICDWRARFFYKHGTTTPVNDNSVLWNSSGQWQQGGQSGTYDINYNAVLAWLTSGPQVLPPNLRAGRVLYYSSIPTSIPSSGLSLDQLFWKNYIDYVIGNASATNQSESLYGTQSSNWNVAAKITSYSSFTALNKPYMGYNDNPIRPRLHFWFGPLSMLSFIGTNNAANLSRNWTAGTVHESQDWQLKAGINSALSDIQKNHPADWVSLIYFSTLSPYGTARVTLGRSYTQMQNALFFPYDLLSSLSDTTKEERPYDSNFNDTTAANVPNANGGTSPQMGFMVAYNQFSGASASGGAGRRGATKLVIFETDGLPNTTGTGTFVNGGAYNSYYSNVSSGTYYGNDDPTVVSNALAVVTRICALDSANPPGYSTAKNKAQVHALAFGDIFNSSSIDRTAALSFLLQVQQAGNTSAGSDTSIQSYKIITGNYQTRIDNIRQALQIIMQSGIQVSLIR
jgi:Flp pilus assembly protein TadG